MIRTDSVQKQKMTQICSVHVPQMLGDTYMMCNIGVCDVFLVFCIDSNDSFSM